MSNIRKAALIIFAAALLAAVGLLFLSGQSDPAYVTGRAIPRYQQIAAGDLVEVRVSRSRPGEFRVVTDKAQLVGMYAAYDLPEGALVAPNMVVTEPPAYRVFSTGKELPEGMRGYPLTVETNLAGVLRDTDRLDLVVVNPFEGTATWLLAGIEPLAIVTRQSGPPTYILALTPEQIAMVEGALADARVDQSGTYAQLVLSQDKNPPPGQIEYSYRDLSPAGVSRP